MLLLELQGRQVRETGMGTYGVVVLAPGFDDDGSFASAAEPLQVQALIAQLSVEGFVSAILPGASRINVRRANVRLLEPVEDGMTDELEPVVGSTEGRRTMKRNQSALRNSTCRRSHAGQTPLAKLHLASEWIHAPIDQPVQR